MTDRLTRHAELAEQYLPDELLERFPAGVKPLDIGTAMAQVGAEIASPAG